MKNKFEAEMVWASSQIDRGDSKAVEPCARPGCHPFPECCITDQDYRYFVEQSRITFQSNENQWEVQNYLTLLCVTSRQI